MEYNNNTIIDLALRGKL